MVTELLPLGQLGVWTSRIGLRPEFAQQVERLGYQALWVGASPGPALDEIEACLDATDSVVLVSSIVNIWRATASETAASFHRIERRHPGRLLLGIGSGHREADQAHTRPLLAMNEYLDVLDAEGVPPHRRLLAALGPKTVAVAAARSRGAHPYLTLPEHTQWARGVMGPDALLAPEQMVISETNPDAARQVARDTLERYLARSNYATVMRDAGFDEAELRDGGSDRLVDAVTPWGEIPALAAVARAHLKAGADHVPVQVLGGGALVVLTALANEFGLTEQ